MYSLALIIFVVSDQTSQEWSLESPLQSLCYFYADRKFKMATTAGHRSNVKLKSCRSRHFEFHTGTKNVKFVEDHLMNIHVQFGFNHICSF
jgi:hypothetical protein